MKILLVKRSFTIIEVLIAIFILEVGILGVSSFFASGFKIIKTARTETITSNLAAGLLDEQLATAYDNLTVGAGTCQKYSTDINSPFYTWSQEIDIAYVNSNLDESYNLLIDPLTGSYTQMKKITVTVFWQEECQGKSLKTAAIKASH